MLSISVTKPGMAIVVEALPPYAGVAIPEWEEAAGPSKLSLVLEFSNLYRRLPPGIPTWGIARAHRFSLQRPWRNLALFRDRDTSACVPTTRRICMQFCGMSLKTLFNGIRDSMSGSLCPAAANPAARAPFPCRFSKSSPPAQARKWIAKPPRCPRRDSTRLYSPMARPAEFPRKYLPERVSTASVARLPDL